MGYVLGGEQAPKVKLWDSEGTTFKVVNLPSATKLEQWFEPDIVQHKLFNGEIKRYLLGHYYWCELRWDHLSEVEAQQLIDIANHAFRIEFSPHGTKSPDDSGTSSGDNAEDTLNDTSKSWDLNVHAGKVVALGPTGTGSGQMRLIASNSATQLVLAGYWETIPDATSQYEINPAFSVDVLFEGDFKLEYLADKYVGHAGTFKLRSANRIENIYFGQKEA